MTWRLTYKHSGMAGVGPAAILCIQTAVFNLGVHQAAQIEAAKKRAKEIWEKNKMAHKGRSDPKIIYEEVLLV